MIQGKSLDRGAVGAVAILPPAWAGKFTALALVPPAYSNMLEVCFMASLVTFLSKAFMENSLKN